MPSCAVVLLWAISTAPSLSHPSSANNRKSCAVAASFRLLIDFRAPVVPRLCNVSRLHSLVHVPLFVRGHAAAGAARGGSPTAAGGGRGRRQEFILGQYRMPATMLVASAKLAAAAAAGAPSASSSQEQLRGSKGLRSTNSWLGLSPRSDHHGFCLFQLAKAAVGDSSRRVRGVVHVQSRKQQSPQKHHRYDERAVRTKAAVNVESAAVTDESTEQTRAKDFERDFTGTPYIPIYVMLPLGIINENNEVADPEPLKYDLRALKSVNVDGVMVDCWWGLVEGKGPQIYDWSGYRQLFNIVRDAGLKLQVVMSFHQCGGNVGDDVNIPIPQWILDIGKTNPDIFFTDRNGARNPECLTWAIDKERVLKNRTALEVYFDYMRSFRQEFDEFFEDGTITEIEIGLGACGELRYPSYPERLGWKYPGIGEFQCYDKYFQKNLMKAAVLRGHADWGHPPDNAGEYNSKPQDTDFFRDGGDYDSYYGRFFLKWYSQALIEHGNNVLTLATLAFEGMKIAAKVSGIHWWYKTASHAAELGAGFYNTAHRDGYLPIAQMLAKHHAAFNFTCVELSTLAQEEGYPEALADPEGLVWQVLNAAWDSNISVASENALPCYDRDGYNKILENAKPFKDPDGRHLVAFTYLRLNPTLMEDANLDEFARFVRRLHGEANS